MIEHISDNVKLPCIKCGEVAAWGIRDNNRFICEICCKKLLAEKPEEDVKVIYPNGVRIQYVTPNE